MFCGPILIFFGGDHQCIRNWDFLAIVVIDQSFWL